MSARRLACFAIFRFLLCFCLGLWAVTGTLPPELGQLDSLEHLILHNNDIAGMVPLGREVRAAHVWKILGKNLGRFRFFPVLHSSCPCFL